MNILNNDYGGYSFQVTLSRELARRGHRVTHTYCASLSTTPPGLYRNGDLPGFDVAPIYLKAPLDKYDLFKRRRQEREYGHLLAGMVDRLQPDIILSGNTPLDAQRTLQRICRAEGIPVVYWAQDLLGVATWDILKEKLPLLGHAVGLYYRRLEGALMRQADAVVSIGDEFDPVLRENRVSADRISVIENWASTDDIVPQPHDNPWSRANGLDATTNFFYTGTLSLKHNPRLLTALAAYFADRPDVRVVAITQGQGAEYLRSYQAIHARPNLVLLPYQPAEILPQVLATADVLVSVLQPQAARFSIPSKVLTYLCAGRAQLCAIPGWSSAVRMVKEAGAGFAVEPGDEAAFLDAASRLLDDPEARQAMGTRARAYAEKKFDVVPITDQFESLFNRLTANRVKKG